MGQMRGRCLCDEINFEVRSATVSAHCHCQYCRLSNGAAFVTWVVVNDPDFKLTKGEKTLKWHSSSPHSRRGFCSNCGSTLFFRSDLCAGEIHVTRANFIDDVPVAPRFHCFSEQKVPWIALTDDLKHLHADSEELSNYQKISPLDLDKPAEL